MTSPNDFSAVHAALVAARISVEHYMARREAHGHGWNEVPATEILCAAASPTLRYVQFTGREESVVGADLLWWFIDGEEEAFGVLTQAKRLRRASTRRWTIDFGYRKGDRRQIDSLLDAASSLSVPAAYLVYGGDAAYRKGLVCGPALPTRRALGVIGCPSRLSPGW